MMLPKGNYRVKKEVLSPRRAERANAATNHVGTAAPAVRRPRYIGPRIAEVIDEVIDNVTRYLPLGLSALARRPEAKFGTSPPQSSYPKQREAQYVLQRLRQGHR